MASSAPDTPGAPGPREAAKQETRRALLAAAREAFAAEGLEKPSLDAICARAGFTRGAFYVHFRDRDELVAAAIEEALRDFVDGVVAAGGAGGDLRSSVERYAGVAAFLRARDAARGGRTGVRFHQVLEAARRAPRVAALLRATSAEARARLTRAGRAAQAEGRATGAVVPEDLATVLLLLALGVMAADELGLPLDVPAARDAVLALLAPERASAK